jgi:hypothetical protein
MADTFLDNTVARGQRLATQGCWEKHSACISEMPKLMEFHVRYQSICPNPLSVLTFCVQWRFTWNFWARRAGGEDGYNLHSNGRDVWLTSWLKRFVVTLWNWFTKATHTLLFYILNYTETWWWRKFVHKNIGSVITALLSEGYIYMNKSNMR